MNQNTPAANRLRISAMTRIALMTALTCILGPLSVPVGPVPVSLGVLAVFLAVYVLGRKQGTISCFLYLLLGLCGLPVFTGFSGGVGKLLGPTGGYLIGYIFMVLIAGFYIEKYENRIPFQFAGMLLGLAVLYLFGTLWLAYSAHMSAQAAFAAGVAPFILIDVCKIIVAIVLGRAIRKGLAAAGLLQG